MSLDRERLAELVERVRRATGPDREIDADICWLLVLPESSKKVFDCTRYVKAGFMVGHGDTFLPYADRFEGCEYTASIDAALGLVERLLGVYSLKITIDPSGNGVELTWRSNGLTSGPRYQANEVSADPVLAILAALLAVLVEQCKPFEPRPIHLRLLRRGERGGYIGLTDDAGIHTAEVVALGELRRAGLVEHAKGPFPPGPPSMTPSVITEAGRALLLSLQELSNDH